MGFFSDLKEDLSQAVNELNGQININEMESTEEQTEVPEKLDAEQLLTSKEPVAMEQEISLDEMLERIDTFGFPEELMQETLGLEQEEVREEEAFLEDGRMLAVNMPDAEVEDWTDDADSFDLEPLWRKIEEADKQTLSEEQLEELLGTQQEEQPTEWQETIQEEPPREEQEILQEEQPDNLQEELSQNEWLEESQEAIQEEASVESQETIREDLSEAFQEVSREVQEMPQEETKEIQNDNHKGAEKEMETSAVRATVDEVSIIAETMTITGDVTSEGSIDLLGTVNGNIEVSGKLSIVGHINGNSKAAEIYAENARINGELASEGAVKIGASSVIIGNIFAVSAVIAGAVEGDIDVQGPVILDSTAIVMGNIKSKSVQINNGAVIEGMCSQCYADISPASFFEDYKPENLKAKSN